MMAPRHRDCRHTGLLPGQAPAPSHIFSLGRQSDETHREPLEETGHHLGKRLRALKASPAPTCRPFLGLPRGTQGPVPHWPAPPCTPRRKCRHQFGLEHGHYERGTTASTAASTTATHRRDHHGEAAQRRSTSNTALTTALQTLHNDVQAIEAGSGTTVGQLAAIATSFATLKTDGLTPTSAIGAHVVRERPGDHHRLGRRPSPATRRC